MASFAMRPLLFLSCSLVFSQTPSATPEYRQSTSDIIRLLQDSRERSGTVPVLSPLDTMLGGDSQQALFDMREVQASGFPVVVWTVNKPERMRWLLSRYADGIISDRPDLLMEELNKWKSAAVKEHDRKYASYFDAQAHRGGRDLRPENTLPAFENALDLLVSTLETDTGVTKDGVSLISHEQFINPQTCRAIDGAEYTEQSRVWIKDLTIADAQRRFVCDKLFRGNQQKNDLSLSPVAAKFAAERHLSSPYVPTYAAQLFDFVSYYADYYRGGPGKRHAQAELRWRNAEKVRFNLETKLTPQSTRAGETKEPAAFVDALYGAIQGAQLENRADIQSFDFRTLALVEKQHPKIRTVYLMESMQWRAFAQ